MATNQPTPNSNTDEPSNDHNADPVDADSTPATLGESETPVVITKAHDRDASAGAKTRKDGKTESFYGYHEHTLVRVQDDGTPADSVPPLIARFELTPASVDVVDVSLSLLDRLPHPAETLIADRHYHYKKTERWRDELADRGIDQVHDLRSDEHGFTDLNGILFGDGWPHCPATPRHLEHLQRPGPVEGASKMKAFERSISERFAYAFRRVTSPDARGVTRFECPAAAGKVGCPRQEGTVQAALELGLPIVENPPDPNSPDLPVCCKQRTVTIDPGHLRKLMQNDYWGSDAWKRVWNKRTYVEGTYGNRKNASTENLRRGHFRTTGIALVNIMTAMAAASYNLRMLRGWHERTGNGDPDHPLLQQKDDMPVFNYLTPEEAERFAEYQHFTANQDASRGAEDHDDDDEGSFHRP